MAKTREIVCINYICAHKCKLGKDADFYGLCQTCNKYYPLKGAKPARTDNRKRKLEKIKKRDLKDY